MEDPTHQLSAFLSKLIHQRCLCVQFSTAPQRLMGTSTGT